MAVLALALPLAALAGFLLGVVGGGGSMLLVPILVYVLGLDAHSAIGVSLGVVALTSAFAAVLHARRGHVDFRTGAAVGGAGMVVAFGCARVAGFIPERALLFLFATVMLVVSIAMLRSRSVPEETVPRDPPSIRIAILIGCGVGVFTGLVGAGGGFVIVPALVFFAAMPMRHAIGTSLFVIALQASAGAIGYTSHVTARLDFVAYVLGATCAGALLGIALGARLEPRGLRKAFGAFVLVLATFILARELYGLERRANEATRHATGTAWRTTTGTMR